MVPTIIGLYSSIPQSGKTTTATYLQQHGYHVLPFASTLKAMIHTFLMDLGYDHAEAGDFLQDKERVIPEIETTTRELCAKLGTEWGRNSIRPDLWLLVWACRYNTLWAREGHNVRVVVDDVRFPNEVEFLRRFSTSFQLWRVQRPGITAAASTLAHPSEGGLDSEKFDAIIYNDGSVTQLYSQIHNVLFHPLPETPALHVV